MQLNAAVFPPVFTDNGVAATFGRGARNLFSLAPTKILNMSCHMEPSYPRTCEEPKKKTVAHQIKPSSCKSVHIHTVHCVRFVTFSACWLHSSVFVYDNHMFWMINTVVPSMCNPQIQAMSISCYNFELGAAGFLLHLDGKFFGMYISVFLTKRPFLARRSNFELYSSLSALVRETPQPTSPALTLLFIHHLGRSRIALAKASSGK